MKNALLEAVKNLKSQKVAILVADAESLPELLGKGVEDAKHEAMEEGGAEMAEEAAEYDSDEKEMAMDQKAEQVLGKKPFQKTDEEGGGSNASMAAPNEEVFDEEYVNRMKTNGQAPKGLYAKGQMMLAKKLNK